MDTMASKLWIAAALWACASVLPAHAQEPKTGDYYEDKTDLGFKVRVPQKWDPIPPSPDDGNLIIKYVPKTNKAIQLGKSGMIDLSVWILKFDRRKNAEAPAPKGESKKLVSRQKDLAAWMTSHGLKGFTSVTQKDVEVNKVAATECVYLSKAMANDEIKLYSMTFKLQPEVDVVFAAWGPGDARKWSKFENAFSEMARSFKAVEAKSTKPELAAGASLRDRKRVELVDALTRTPGWKLYETPNYFFVSSNPDKAFLDELMGRLEAIRTVYEQDYPASKAKELREEAARLRTASVEKGKKDEGGDDAEPKDKPEAAPAKTESKPDLPDNSELARCSVVRVCKNAAEYHSYNGPPQAAGHWDSNAQELVIYDDRASGGKGDTWITLNHEAFHQYIYYFYGNIAPHSWYNEGTGDFYSGYMFKNGRFTLEKNPWRRDMIREVIRNENFVPLTELMRWNQREYYGQNKRAAPGVAGGGENYAEGWSLIFFLRTGKKNKAKGWDLKWDSILEDYLKSLASTGKPEKAIEQCLSGIDVDALQAAWLEYTK